MRFNQNLQITNVSKKANLEFYNTKFDLWLNGIIIIIFKY